MREEGRSARERGLGRPSLNARSNGQPAIPSLSSDGGRQMLKEKYQKEIDEIIQPVSGEALGA